MLELIQKFKPGIATNQYTGTPIEAYRWRIDRRGMRDSKGIYCRVGSWSANFWFCVAQGKTDKQTLGYAKVHLKAITKAQCTFEYEEDNS